MLPSHPPSDTQPQAPPPCRESAECSADTAQPSVTSGFGTVLEHERDLQRSIEACLRSEEGANATSAHHVLRDHSAQIRGNIALLAQRYESLPHPERFRTLQARIAQDGPAANPRIDPLAPLIVQHRNLLAAVATLIRHRPDGQRGELILGEVARSHEEMSATLAALAFPDGAGSNSASAPTRASCGTTDRSQATELHASRSPERPSGHGEGAS